MPAPLQNAAAHDKLSVTAEGRKTQKRGTAYEIYIQVTGLKVVGGCSGNLQGIAKLVEGMEIDEVIKRLEGIRCGFKSTSCPDQIAKALEQYKSEL